MSSTVSRRSFLGGITAAVGCLTAEAPLGAQAPAVVRQPRPRLGLDEYDAAAKLAYNENPYGPSEAVMKAMNTAFKYDNRYGYPDGDLVQRLATHHGIKPDNLLLGAGSGEILQVADRAFLGGGRKVVGVTPTFTEVYEYAAGVRSESILLPLREDYGQDIGALVKTTKINHRDVGFVYVCTPNNPTGVVVTRQEIKQLLDGIPEDVPVLIDEAYHHYVDTPDYATSIPYVLEGRPVIVTRTFSKIYGLAGMRLGYAIAPKAAHRSHAAALHREHQCAREVGRRHRAWRYCRRRACPHQHAAAAPEDDRRARGNGIQGPPVRDQLLHGAHPPPGAAGDRRVPDARRAGRASVSADARAPSCLGGHTGRNGALPRRVQGNRGTEDSGVIVPS